MKHLQMSGKINSKRLIRIVRRSGIPENARFIDANAELPFRIGLSPRQSVQDGQAERNRLTGIPFCAQLHRTAIQQRKTNLLLNGFSAAELHGKPFFRFPAGQSVACCDGKRYFSRRRSVIDRAERHIPFSRSAPGFRHFNSRLHRSGRTVCGSGTAALQLCSIREQSSL